MCPSQLRRIPCGPMCLGMFALQLFNLDGFSSRGNYNLHIFVIEISLNPVARWLECLSPGQGYAVKSTARPRNPHHTSTTLQQTMRKPREGASPLQLVPARSATLQTHEFKSHTDPTIVGELAHSTQSLKETAPKYRRTRNRCRLTLSRFTLF